VATNTAPRHWRDEDDSTLATVLDVLNKQAEQANRKRGRHG
jgi:hypothetical protein